MNEWRGSKPLGAVTAPTLTVSCEKCGRQRTREVAELINQYGPDHPMPDVPKLVFKDCPRYDGQYFDRCEARFGERRDSERDSTAGTA